MTGAPLSLVKENGSCRTVRVEEVVNPGAKRGSVEIWTTYAVAPPTRVQRIRPWTPEVICPGAVTAGASSGAQLCGAATTAKWLSGESNAAHPSARCAR